MSTDLDLKPLINPFLWKNQLQRLFTEEAGASKVSDIILCFLVACIFMDSLVNKKDFIPL
jgi:hypothetical protein